jgi:flagellar hook-associated protein 3 FlgL
MTISSKLYNQQAVSQFNRLTEDAQKLQSQVASGKAFTESADAPTQAVKLSATKVLRAAAERFSDNIATAQNRLAVADSSLGASVNALTRISELAVQAGNDTLNDTDRTAIATEVKQLRGLLVSLGNTRDGNGQAIFGGLRTSTDPFVTDADGGIAYQGDDGRHSVAISTSQRLSTSLDGADAFMRVATSEGPQSVFDVIDGFIAAVENRSGSSDSRQTTDNAELRFSAAREPQTWQMRLTGPSGSANLSFDLVDGEVATAMTAINDASGTTGITASLTGDGLGLVLTATSGGIVKLDRLQIEGADGTAIPADYSATVSALDSNGDTTGSAQLTDQRHRINGAIANIRDTIEHVALRQAEVGSYLQVAELQSKIMDDRMLQIEKDVSKLQDADLAVLITQMQSLVLNRDAAQKAYATVSQRSLFDFM